MWTTTYDAAGRLTGMTDPLGHHTTVTLNPAGQVASSPIRSIIPGRSGTRTAI
jgi:uncharacterized protein RhaS with RHS repeats